MFSWLGLLYNNLKLQFIKLKYFTVIFCFKMSHIQLRSIHLSNLVQVRKHRMFLLSLFQLIVFRKSLKPIWCLDNNNIKIINYFKANSLHRIICLFVSSSHTQNILLIKYFRKWWDYVIHSPHKTAFYLMCQVTV